MPVYQRADDLPVASVVVVVASRRAGALIILKNSNVVCGISGEISSIPNENFNSEEDFKYEY